jgi:hypothetical protein
MISSFHLHDGYRSPATLAAAAAAQLFLESRELDLTADLRRHIGRINVVAVAAGMATRDQHFPAVQFAEPDMLKGALHHIPLSAFIFPIVIG